MSLQEWYYPLLKPWGHYVPVWANSSGVGIAEAVEWANTHPMAVSSELHWMNAPGLGTARWSGSPTFTWGGGLAVLILRSCAGQEKGGTGVLPRG